MDYGAGRGLHRATTIHKNIIYQSGMCMMSIIWLDEVSVTEEDYSRGGKGQERVLVQVAVTNIYLKKNLVLLHIRLPVNC